MGIFDSLFGKKNENVITSEDIKRYKELICFINFSKKIKPMTGGNYGITVTYHAPERGYTSELQATFGFYDFDEIRFARDFALKGNNARMAQFYYKNISEQVGLSQTDWPYGIDADDFVDVLKGTFVNSYFTLIPDEYNDDIFTFKVVGGLESRNALLVSNIVFDVIKTKFPELSIQKNHATPYSMMLTIQI